MTNSVFRLRRSSVDLIRKFSLSTGKVPRTSQIAFLGFAIKNLSSSANQDNDFGTARASLFSLRPMRTHSTVPSTKNEAVSTFQSVDATKVSEDSTKTRNANGALPKEHIKPVNATAHMLQAPHQMRAVFYN